MQRKHKCGDYVESQYYNPFKTGARGGRITTSDACAIFYSNQDIISQDKIKKKQDIGGKNPLLVCKGRFDLNIKIPISGG